MKADIALLRHPVTGDVWVLDRRTGRTIEVMSYGTRYLTEREQGVMHRALRGSTRLIAEGERMANVFEGEPDGRQSTEEDFPLSRFRPRYRALSDEEKLLHDQIKAAFRMVESLIDRVPKGRYQALAMTSLEASCMWAVKALTDNK